MRAFRGVQGGQMEGGETAPEADAEVGRVVEALSHRFGARVPRPLIEEVVRDCVAQFRDASVRDFVSLLAERAAAERLRSLQSSSST